MTPTEMNASDIRNFEASSVWQVLKEVLDAHFVEQTQILATSSDMPMLMRAQGSLEEINIMLNFSASLLEEVEKEQEMNEKERMD
jgi:hypothetical protein